MAFDRAQKPIASNAAQLQRTSPKERPQGPSVPDNVVQRHGASGPAISSFWPPALRLPGPGDGNHSVGEVTQRKENRTGLPDRLKAGAENLSGLSLDNVRVHYNSPRPAPLYALAYTQGTDIHVGPGQERHLPHELWHVVQQTRGPVAPTFRIGSVPVNDDASLEREADVMGAKSLQTEPPTQRLAQQTDQTKGAPQSAAPVLQGYFTYGGVRQRNLNAELASIFAHSDGFHATLRDYQARRDNQDEATDLGEWFYQQIDQRGWADRSNERRGDLGLSISAFIANYATGQYNAPVENQSNHTATEQLDSLPSKESKSKSSGASTPKVFKKVPLRQGLIRGTYEEEPNAADLHVDKGDGTGLMADMLAVAQDVRRRMHERALTGGPSGWIELHPTGAAIVKIIAQLLGETLGSSESKQAAQKAMLKRKKSEKLWSYVPLAKKGEKAEDTLHPSVHAEHFHYLSSLRGAAGLEMRTVLPGTAKKFDQYLREQGVDLASLDEVDEETRKTVMAELQEQYIAEMHAETNQNMLETTPEADARFEQYQQFARGGGSVSLRIRISVAQLGQVIALLSRYTSK